MKKKKHRSPNRREAGLQRSWSRTAQGGILGAVGGERIVVLAAGTWNVEEGPDFRNAEIEIDGVRRVGDIEIHRRAGDWFAHGHECDGRYANVVLHLVGDTTGAEKWRQRVPQVPIAQIQPVGLRTSSIMFNKYPPGDCASWFRKMTDAEVRGFFQAQGRLRFIDKSRRLLGEMLEKGAEWAFMRKLFEACGYKKNTENFASLYDRFQAYEPETLSVDDAVGALWGESGLLPDPGVVEMSDTMRRFAEDAWSRWWRVRRGHGEQVPWHVSGARPQNSPCRRIAALTVLMRRYGVEPFAALMGLCLAAIDTPERFWKGFKDKLICSDEVWDGHVNFETVLPRRASVMGTDRARDVVANVLLPAVHARLMILGEEARVMKVEEAWRALPPAQSNIILKIGSGRWLLPPARARRIFNDLASQQGCLHFFQTRCDSVRANCESCLKELPLAPL